jgi:polysaccharide biosynthesis/export protein
MQTKLPISFHHERSSRRQGRSRLGILGLGLAVFALFLQFALVAVPPVTQAQTLTKRPVGTDPEASTNLKLAPGDLINLQVFDTPELSARLRVSQGGLIDLPVAGPLAVAGMSPTQADQAVEKRLRDAQIMQDPRVTILVVEYSSEGVNVLGEVNKPGKYVLLGMENVYDALSAAGGTTDKLGATIVITHESDPTHPITILVDSPDFATMEQLTKVEPGDVVMATRAKSIFVFGDVAKPGEYPILFGERLNVLDAVALAQGINRTASATKASIVRQTEERVETIKVNLDKIAKNKEPDPVLQPGDILVVPRSGAKSFVESTVPGATGAVAGAVAAALVYR